MLDLYCTPYREIDIDYVVHRVATKIITFILWTELLKIVQREQSLQKLKRERQK